MNVRKITPQHFYLVPGVGSQGGSLKEISEKAMIMTLRLALSVVAGKCESGYYYASGKETLQRTQEKKQKLTRKMKHTCREQTN